MDKNKNPPVAVVVSVNSTGEVTTETFEFMIVKRVKLLTQCMIMPGIRLPKCRSATKYAIPGIKYAKSAKTMSMPVWVVTSGLVM